MSINVIEGPATVGSGIGKGLNRLIEGKINDLHQYRKTEDKRALYAKMQLPDWLSDLPEEVQNKILSEFEAVPPAQKPKVIELMNNIGLDKEDIEYENVEEAPGVERHEEGGLYTPLDVAQQQNKQAQEQSSMPGVNGLMQAGADQRQQGGSGNDTQMFPQMKHGTMGQANPQESTEPSQGWTFRPKSERKGSRGIGGLTPYQEETLALSKEKAKNTQENKEQEKIKSLNEPFTNQLDKEVPTAEQILDKARYLLDLENSDKTPENPFTQAYAQYTPGFLNTYNEYNAKSNELAALMSVKTGRPSVFMTKLALSSKPHSGMAKQERINLLEDIVNKAEPIIELSNARDDVITENDGLQPRDLKALSIKRAIDRSIPDASEFAPGTVIELYNRKFKNKDGEWIPVSEKGK